MISGPEETGLRDLLAEVVQRHFEELGIDYAPADVEAEVDRLFPEAHREVETISDQSVRTIRYARRLGLRGIEEEIVLSVRHSDEPERIIQALQKQSLTVTILWIMVVALLLLLGFALGGADLLGSMLERLGPR